MNSPRQEVKINYDSQEWITDFDGGIASVEVDGKKLYGHESWREWIKDRAILVMTCAVLFGYALGSSIGNGLAISSHSNDEISE